MDTPFSSTVDFQADRAQLFSRAPSKIFLGHIASAAILIYLAFDVLALHWLVAWGVLEVLITPTLLYVLGKRAQRSQQHKINLDTWQIQLNMLFALVGVSWGTFVFFGLDVQNSAHLPMQMAIVAGASAAASRSLGIFKKSYFVYVIPFAGLLAVRVFMLGGDFVLLGLLVLVFIVMMCGLANDTSKELSVYLATKLENLDLAEKYKTAAAEAERANMAKSQFLTHVNHDLRQPIHAIGLLTESLRDQELDNEGMETLDTIDSSVETLAKLFKSLLNVTSLDAGAVKPEITSTSLKEVLNQAVRQARPEALERGCGLELIHTSLWVDSDAALLGSILQNLISNAVKYAPGSRIVVGVRRSGNTASIHVLDQGDGISNQLRENVFDEFVRGNPDGPRRTEGLGLGLSIVSRTAELLNLGVEFNSIENVGTHVALTGFEIVPPRNAWRNYQVDTIDGQADQKILVIDDNVQVLAGMRKLLSKWGYPVQCLEPHEKLPTEFDVLVIDFHLNGYKNGFALAKEIMESSGRSIPTIIISGTISPELEWQSNEEGFWTLLKPVSPAKLRSLLLSAQVENQSKRVL